jgi:hypothetical protein
MQREDDDAFADPAALLQTTLDGRPKVNVAVQPRDGRLRRRSIASRCAAIMASMLGASAKQKILPVASSYQ